MRGIETFQKFCHRYNLVPAIRKVDLATPTPLTSAEAAGVETAGGLAEIIDISRGK